MTIPFAFHTVVRHRAVTETDAGNSTVKRWDIATQQTITGCNVQPLNGQDPRETDAAGTINQTTDMLRVHAPPASDIRADDRVLFDGKMFEVVGIPQKHADPFTGGWHHLYVVVRYISG